MKWLQHHMHSSPLSRSPRSPVTTSWWTVHSQQPMHRMHKPDSNNASPTDATLLSLPLLLQLLLLLLLRLLLLLLLLLLFILLFYQRLSRLPTTDGIPTTDYWRGLRPQYDFDDDYDCCFSCFPTCRRFRSRVWCPSVSYERVEVSIGKKRNLSEKAHHAVAEWKKKNQSIISKLQVKHLYPRARPAQTCPAVYMSVPSTVAAPRRPFMSSGPMIRQSALALVIATVARAYASSSCTICSSSGKARKYFLRPLRKPTLVWARITVWAVMPP